MAYPPSLPPNTRADSTVQAGAHADDHNKLVNALTDIITVLGAAPQGAFASMDARLASLAASVAGALTSGDATTLIASWIASNLGNVVNERQATAAGGGKETIVTPGATTGTVTIDCSAGSVFPVSPTGDITLSFTNVPSGRSCFVTVIVTQGGTVRTVTMPGSVKGNMPAQVASNTCVFNLLTVDGGTTWYGAGTVY